jgi:hypothetical protein
LQAIGSVIEEDIGKISILESIAPSVGHILTIVDSFLSNRQYNPNGSKNDFPFESIYHLVTAYFLTRVWPSVQQMPSAPHHVNKDNKTNGRDAL